MSPKQLAGHGSLSARLESLGRRSWRLRKRLFARLSSGFVPIRLCSLFVLSDFAACAVEHDVCKRVERILPCLCSLSHAMEIQARATRSFGFCVVSFFAHLMLFSD